VAWIPFGMAGRARVTEKSEVSAIRGWFTLAVVVTAAVFAVELVRRAGRRLPPTARFRQEPPLSRFG